ncbi:hypothetical protein RhiirA1_413830 [Rhizophagus irregularis]|uniref:Uncharacterized protein n=1 Tax=Rhizophagus irregularis TaxID=588596 RepID=A0A2I1F9D4_9GLOM|nr:hypothetical protein RhiirA1_413830 [Rhizophagus irregularis]PKK65954.1 hypothetical protein RhiirC2_754276 [Rhizophagus irregularis]PKY30990.1 hypothetical protein RhiirB3_419192 [Rhizophagus irregularis]
MSHLKQSGYNFTMKQFSKLASFYWSKQPITVKNSYSEKVGQIKTDQRKKLLNKQLEQLFY